MKGPLRANLMGFLKGFTYRQIVNFFGYTYSPFIVDERKLLAAVDLKSIYLLKIQMSNIILIPDSNLRKLKHPWVNKVDKVITESGTI